MASLLIVDRAGRETEVRARVGATIMEIIRDAGFDDLLALCGGCCSCGTCHVYVAEERLAELPPMGGDEDGMLAISDVRTPVSRLSCQLPFEASMDRIRVTIAPSD